jgi:hypothetical protein
LGVKTSIVPASADWHASNDTPAAATEARTLFRGTELDVTGSSDAPRAVNDERIDLCLDIVRLRFSNKSLSSVIYWVVYHTNSGACKLLFLANKGGTGASACPDRDRRTAMKS